MFVRVSQRAGEVYMEHGYCNLLDVMVKLTTVGADHSLDGLLTDSMRAD